MDLFDEKIRALENFNPEREVILAVKEHEAEVIAMNTQDQLYKFGIESSGKPITPLYKPYTVLVKQSKGQPVNRVTLKDTGQFHEDFVIVYGQYQFGLISTNNKIGKLIGKYGKQIFGLTNINIGKLSQTIALPFLLKKFRAAI